MTISAKPMQDSRIVGAYRLEVETGGFVSFDLQLTNSPHKHDYFEICLVTGGRGRYIHGGAEFLLEKGSVFLAEPGVVHEITSFETKDLHLFFITLSYKKVSERLATPEGGIVEAFVKARAVAAQGHDGLESYLPLIYGNDKIANFSVKTNLHLFALELMNTLAADPVLNREEQPSDEVAKAIAFIDSRLGQKVTVEEVADALGVSSRTLRRKFNEAHKTTLVDEINHRRMRQAAHRLLMGFGVTEAASHIGIADPAQFSRAFKRAFGQGPKEFQQTYRPGALGRQTRPGS